jgi:GT2 family glycosyltransferase
MGKTGKGRLARRNVLASAAAAVLLLWLVLAPSGSNNRNVGAMMTAQKTATVGIVITVSGAPLYVTECLESLYKNTPEMTWVYVSDDSPTDEVAAEIRSITEMLPRITYLRVQSDDRPAGYTVTANLGLSTSYAAGHDVSVMVNSDTVFTPGWLPPLLRAIQEDPRIGMAGPMSNAATYQSTPLVKANGGWATNMPYPTGWNTDKMARLVQLVSAGKHANVPILNGFVFAIRREVIRAIGVFDVEKFPKGYGEENDYAFRARAAGYEFVVCTNRCGTGTATASHARPAVGSRIGQPQPGPSAAGRHARLRCASALAGLRPLPYRFPPRARSFVQHYMSKSFGHTTRKKLSAEASVVLKAMYKEELAAAAQALDSHPVLAEARRRVAFHLKTGKPVLDAVSAPLSVLFVLNAQPQRHFNMRGGWVAVVQEALGLADNGAYVRVAVPAWQVPFFNTAFPDAEAYGMFFGYNDRGSDALAAVELVESGLVFDIGVATHYLTVEVIRTIRRTYPSMIPAFYIQDGAGLGVTLAGCCGHGKDWSLVRMGRSSAVECRSALRPL